jgi:[protein-PII] uridylyltransferase
MPADVLDVVALDRTGWFARVAGVIALHGGRIVAAEAFSRVDGLAIDTFRVRPPKGAGGSWWARVEGDLHDASSGRLAVRARVIRMARTDRERIRRRDRVPTSVRRVGDVGDTTIVEVRAVDRTGVLYSIASSLAELEIDIIGARVRTVGREAIDEFACRGPDGVLDDDRLVEAELAVVTSIDEL